MRQLTPSSTLFPYTTLFRSTSGLLAGDVLAFTNTDPAKYGNIAPSYDATHGVLTLTSLGATATLAQRSEEHTSELQSLRHLVCRLLLEKKKNTLNVNR